MSGCIAVINAGSSSVKFALYEASGEANVLFRGQVEGIGVAPHLRIEDTHGRAVAEQNWPADGFDHVTATRELLRTGTNLIEGRQVVGIGHRVVHGGMHYAAPIRLDRAVLTSLSELIPLAPLHQPHNLAPIRTILDVAPQIPQIACFDTAFHRSQAQVAQSFALPRHLTEAGIRRYGFHGLSYEYLVSQLAHHSASACVAATGHCTSGQRRQPMCRKRLPERREHDGIHCSRWPDDGDTLRCAGPWRPALSHAAAPHGCGIDRRSDLPEVGITRRLQHIVRYAHASRVVRIGRPRGNRSLCLSYR